VVPQAERHEEEEKLQVAMKLLTSDAICGVESERLQIFDRRSPLKLAAKKQTRAKRD
jgi:hypothetical protein